MGKKIKSKRSGSASAQRSQKLAENKARIAAMSPEERQQYEQELLARREKRKKIQQGRMRRRRQRMKLISRLLVVLVIIAALFVSAQVLFKVTTVKVENPNRENRKNFGAYSEEEIVQALDIAVGTPVFGFSTRERAARLEVLLPALENIQVRLSLPSTVVVSVEPAKEKYLTKTENGEYVVLSEKLKVTRLEKDRPSGLIRLRGVDPETAQAGYILNLTGEEDEEASDQDEKKKPTDKNQLLQQLIEYMNSEKLTKRITEIRLKDENDLSFVYDGRITVELGSTNSLPYKMQLAGYLLRNEKGDALGDNDEGVLDCSHITQSGDIRPVFAPEATPTPTPIPEPEPDETGESTQG